MPFEIVYGFPDKKNLFVYYNIFTKIVQLEIKIEVISVYLLQINFMILCQWLVLQQFEN